MKRKLILFITCFFLFSSLTVFFVHRHLRSPEVSKKENNEEEKKENKKEADDDLPWQFTWKGAIISLIPSIGIGFIIVFVIIRFCELQRTNDKNKNKLRAIAFFIIASLICLFLYSVVCPLILAIQKYKNKSYGERFKLAAYYSHVKKIIIIILIIIIVFLVVLFFIFYCKFVPIN